MGEFGFGRDFRMQTDSTNKFLPDAIVASNVRTSLFVQYPELAKLKLEKLLYPQGSLMRRRF